MSPETAIRNMHHMRFVLLSPDEQRALVQRLATAGWRDQAIANLTGLSIKQIRVVRAEVTG